MHAMRTIFLKAPVYAAWVAIAFAVSSALWVLSFGQALAGVCPAASCSVALMNGNSLGTGAFDNMNFAVSVNVATFDINLSNGNRVGKVDFPSAPGLADNLGGKLTMANFKIFNLQELSPALGNGASITDLRQLLQQFTARGETSPAPSSPPPRLPDPASLALLASGLFLALGLLRWKRVI